MFKIHELISVTRARLVEGKVSREVSGISIDSRSIKLNQAFVAIKGDNFDGHDFIPAAIAKGATCIIRSKLWRCRPQGRVYPPKVTIIEVEDTIAALGDIAHFHRRRFDKPVVAITGSSGKTTAKEMAAWVLEEKFQVLKNTGTQNNHIGVPLTLLKLTAEHSLAVVEMGTNHFGEIANLSRICSPTIGVITNIGPAHLEFFGSLQGVLREKYSLIEQLNDPYIAVVNSDDPFLKKNTAGPSHKPFVIGFGQEGQADFRASGIHCRAGKTAFTINKKYGFTLNTAGCHNIYNALAAVAVARILGLGYRECAHRLKNFVFPPGRGQLIMLGGAHFIDDTYNSNPLSLRQALATVKGCKNKGRKICVLGDMLELGKQSASFHWQAGALAAKACDILIAVGKMSGITAQGARCARLKAQNIYSCRDSGEAAEILDREVSPQKGDLVLAKGSRAMKMEEVLKKFESKHAV